MGLTLREFKRRTNGWSNDIELTIGFDGKIYDVVEFCGYRESYGGSKTLKREMICFIPELDGQD